jgi:ketosteroid isomerase-like protein
MKTTDLKTHAVAMMLLCLAGTTQSQAQTPLQEMVQTEQAFSRMAAEKNVRDAFMEFIADDGLLFRPTAVNGKKWMNEHPVPASDKHPLLAWQPAFAGMSAAGDLGFTTGPWEFKEDVKDEKPAGYGHFVTLWKKQPDGKWRFVVDLGINHPMSGGPQRLWQPLEEKSPTKVQRVDVAIARRNLLDWDRSYLQFRTKHGLVKAFMSFASPDVRLYRVGSLPFIGRTVSANALESAKGEVSWTTVGGDVSRSGDLGYTYGTYEVTDAAKVTERGSYVRIWQKEGRLWQIVLDVANPQQ